MATASSDETRLTLAEGSPAVIECGDMKAEFNLQGAQGVVVYRNGIQVFPAAAPNIITDSKTSTRLKQLHDIGELVSGKGVYLDTVKLPAKFGIELPEGYLWAAPQGLKAATGELLTYNATLPEIANLIDFHGRNGVYLKDRPRDASRKPYEQALYEYFKALAAGDASVREGWTLGIKEIVHGRQMGESRITVANNLYSLRNEMPEGSKFITRRSAFHARCQWSCTEHPDPSLAYVVDFMNGGPGWERKNDRRLSARPVCLAFQP